MAASRSSLIQLQNKLTWSCIITCIMYVPNLTENWQSISKIPHIFKNQDNAASQPSSIWYGNKLSWTCILTCVMYVPNLNKNRQSMFKILHFQKSRWPPVSHLWSDWRTIVMDMYPNMNNVFTKFEWKLTKHVQDTTHFQKTIWLPVNHLWSNCKTNCHEHVF